jgi:hypothetical protein
MIEIDVQCRAAADRWTCAVAVDDGAGAPTTHEVSVATADLARLAPGARDPADLVRRSFAFLLEREPKESILRQFDLSVVARYFPEYEGTIRD